MGDNAQLGTIILKLLVDNKEFADGLKNSLQLTSIASTQMKDLMEFRIKSPDFSALDLAVEANQKKIGELTTAQHEQAGASQEEAQGADEAARKHAGHAESAGKGTKALREFRTEQRTQNFVVRESSQALLGLTTAVGFLTLGNKDAEGTSKRLQSSLLAGVTAADGMEFGLFGMGQAAKNLGGPLGATIQKITGMAGSISAVVGLGVGLVAFFQAANEESEKAVQHGLRDFETEFSRLSGSQQLTFAQDIERGLKNARAELNKLIADAKVMQVPRAGGIGTADIAVFSEQEAKRKGMLEEDIRIMDRILDRTKEQREETETLARTQKLNDDELLKVGNELQQQDITLKRLKETLAAGKDIQTDRALTEAEIRRLVDDVAAAELRRANLLKSSLDLAKDSVSFWETEKALGLASADDVLEALGKEHGELVKRGADQKDIAANEVRQVQVTQQKYEDLVAIAQARHSLGLGSVEDVIRELQALKQAQPLLKDRLETELKIQEIQRAQRDQAMKQYGPEIPEATKERIEAEKGFIVQKKSLDALAIADKYGREKATAQNQFDSDVLDIRHRGWIAKMSDEEVAAAIKDRATILNRDLTDIETARIVDLGNLQLASMGQTFDAEKQQISNTYEAQIRQVDQLGLSEVQKVELVSGLKKARDREIAALELQQMQRSIGAGESLMHDIVGLAAHLGPEAQEFVDGLQRAFDIAKSIVSIIQTISTITSWFALQSGGVVLAAQSGVMVPGAGDGDKIPIMAEPGEGIINKRAVQALGGPGAIIAINRMLPRFASGGSVGSVSLPIVRDLASAASDVTLRQTVGQVAKYVAQSQGAFDSDMADALIGEVRNLREEMKNVRTETRDLADRINTKLEITGELTLGMRDLRAALRIDDKTRQAGNSS